MKTLLESIKNHFPKLGRLQQPERAPVPSKPVNIEAASASASLESWQAKLRTKLIEQLGKDELKPITDVYIKRLIKINADLTDDKAVIATHLVAGSGDRYLQIQEFLSAVKKLPNPSQSTESAIEVLLGYLLQTLVRKNCETGDQGLTRIHVENNEMAKLIGASRTTYSFLPAVSEKQKEHRNGQKQDPFSQNIDHFFPESGSLMKPPSAIKSQENC